MLDGDEATFQVQVFETPLNDVAAQFLYLDTDFDNASFEDGISATIGYQLDINTALQYSYNVAGAVTPSTVLSLRAPEAPSLDENGNGIPDECEGAVVHGDTNCDGAADVFDIDAFVMAITDATNYAATYPACDITPPTVTMTVMSTSSTSTPSCRSSPADKPEVD